MAVYTRFSQDELNEFLSHYRLGTITELKEIEQGVENSNYFLTTTTGKYVLTIYEKRINHNDLPYFLSFTEYLNQQNIATPLAVKNIHNESVTNFKNKKAAIIHFLQGHNLATPNVEQCSSAGAFIAKMHLVQEGFHMHRPNNLSPSGSLWTLYDFITQEIKNKFPQFYPIITSEVLYLQENYPDNLPAGNIHADIFPDNMFFDNNKAIGIIDFYFSCTDFLAYDLAIALCAWCFDNGTLNNNKFSTMLSAYQTIRPLNSLEKDNLLILMRGVAMRFFLTRTHDFIFHDKNALVIPKNPQEYFDILLFLQNCTANHLINLSNKNAT